MTKPGSSNIPIRRWLEIFLETGLIHPYLQQVKPLLLLKEFREHIEALPKPPTTTDDKAKPNKAIAALADLGYCVLKNHPDATFTMISRLSNEGIFPVAAEEVPPTDYHSFPILLRMNTETKAEKCPTCGHQSP